MTEVGYDAKQPPLEAKDDTKASIPQAQALELFKKLMKRKLWKVIQFLCQFKLSRLQKLLLLSLSVHLWVPRMKTLPILFLDPNKSGNIR